MTDIFVTTTHNPPISEVDIQRLVAKSGGCFDTHRVKWRNLLLARDGSRTLCHVDAVDMESVRQVMRRLGLAVEALWTAEPLPSNPGGEWPVNRVTEISLETRIAPDSLTVVPALCGHHCRRYRSLNYLSLDGQRLLTFASVADSCNCPQFTGSRKGGSERTWTCQQVTTCVQSH